MRTYNLPHRQKPDPTPAHTCKGIAKRYYQLKTGHALIGTYPPWRTLRESDTCWWCSEDTPQNLHHLFKWCPKWKEQQRTLWKGVQEATKERHQITEHDPMLKVFADWRCSQAILNFLAHTEVGRGYPRPPAGEADEAGNTEDDDDEPDIDDPESLGNTDDDDGPEVDVLDSLDNTAEVDEGEEAEESGGEGGEER